MQEYVLNKPGGRSYGAAIRAYDPKVRRWAIRWIDGRYPLGALDPPVVGGFDHGVGTFGGPTHGEGIPPLHLAAQAGQEEAVDLLLELGADPTIRDAIYGGDAAGWAAHGCRPDLAERLSAKP